MATHSKGHTLDVVITKCGDSLLCGEPLVRNTGVGNKHGHLTCDHHAVSFQASVRKPVLVRQDVTFRRLPAFVCVENFISDLRNCQDLDSDCTDANELVSGYTQLLTALVDQHASLCRKSVLKRPHAPWYNDMIRSAKSDRRKAEWLWQATTLSVHHQAYRETRTRVNRLLYEVKQAYYTTKVKESVSLGPSSG